ncbi:alpha/beta hydrolase family protein [Flexivirga oryzae]|uniref:Acetyl esterase/lipase n=1 Tax=Flexivirga oryzae TaxID=1794944 RepID=A0A839NBL7_9MICO|nr:alpha/beta hydrolase [Flexivirga oryzae]MBB2891982.1 acetyl esterase/lipase [Flexivirga oryzae]
MSINISVENPDASMRYGSVSTQVADVFEPPDATDSLVLLLHGGFWDDPDRMRAWSAGHALAEAGHLTAAVEYRRGNGGWRNALDDVVQAIDQIQLSGREWTIHNEVPRAITVVGHSAGGQLALWAASRSSLPSTSRWFTTDIQVTGAVALAPIADLRLAAELGLGDAAVPRFLGGAPDELPDHYALADPSLLTPSVPVRILHGPDDDVVPVEISERYAQHLGESGTADWKFSKVDGADHRSWGDPSTAAWSALTTALDDVTGAAGTG